MFACNIRANAESVGFAASSNKQPPVTLRRYKNNVFDALAADRCLRSSRPMLSNALGTLLQQKANTRAALKPYTASSSQLTMFEKRFRPPQHNLDGAHTHTFTWCSWIGRSRLGIQSACCMCLPRSQRGLKCASGTNFFVASVQRVHLDFALK